MTEDRKDGEGGKKTKDERGKAKRNKVTFQSFLQDNLLRFESAIALSPQRITARFLRYFLLPVLLPTRDPDPPPLYGTRNP